MISIQDAIIFVIFFFLGYASAPAQTNEIAAYQCNESGSFTSGNTEYHCAKIEKSAIKDLHKRKFESCRKYLHNPWRTE